MFDELLYILKNGEDLEDWFNFYNRRELDIYSGNDPNQLWKTLDSAPTTTFNKILDIFQVYFLNLGIGVNRLRIEEFLFWDGFTTIAKERKTAWRENKRNTMKIIRLDYFIAQVAPALDKYAEDKSITRQGENRGQDEV